MIERLLGKFGLARSSQVAEPSSLLEERKQPAKPARVRRSFKAGIVDRLTAGFVGNGLSADANIRLGLRQMRNRSRNLFYNTDLAKNYIRILKTNVIGPEGIRLISKPLDRSGSIDRAAKKEIEAKFKKWSKRGNCDVTRKLSLADCQRLFLEEAARSGEVMVRKVTGFNNAFGFALQFLEADLLDETLNQVLANGNVVRMGIEFDTWDAPVAYYFLNRHPGDYLYTANKNSSLHTRIPAGEIIHGFLTEYARQSRGVPWGHAVMLTVDKLDGYEEAELVKSRLAASVMGFFKEDPNLDTEYEGDEAEPEDEELIEQAEPGIFKKLPAGISLETFDPQYPAGNFEPFTKRGTRRAAAGWGVNYNSLAQDFADVNFSSLRQAALEARDFFKELQTWEISIFCEPVFEAWLPAAILSRQVLLPMAKLDKFLEHAWRPRRWPWVDPVKDMTAKSLALANKLTSRSRIAEETGEDFEEILQEIEHETELANSYGVDLQAPQTKAPSGKSLAKTTA